MFTARHFTPRGLKAQKAASSPPPGEHTVHVTVTYVKPKLTKVSVFATVVKRNGKQ
jgi:hypothetical protein